MLYSHENKRMKRYTLRLALHRIASLKIREERKRGMMEEVFYKKKPAHFFLLLHNFTPYPHVRTPLLSKGGLR